MSSKAKLNLMNTISWVGLLQFQKNMEKMAAGDTIDIVTDNGETSQAVSKLVNRSGGEVIHSKKDGDNFLIRVQKG
ncbi:MAG: sulfurtransferase TusA family protein [Deltaproteobacteria bacterium]|nr:sulfurtransferase TusA family protein [Deltaproteobacteria bacterium]